MRFLLRDDPTRQLTHDELVAQAAQYLTLMGWFVIVTHGPKHRPITPGVTDLIAMRRGQNLLLEVKTERRKQDPDQVEFADRAIRCNLEVRVVRTLDEVIAIATARDGER
ncbi:MAG TPA: hypothetical protein VJ553_00960 [Candidatus Paceibacterota bacterium]|nr:hypothetical protein [Candidatus Paceibacterota bacterium]